MTFRGIRRKPRSMSPRWRRTEITVFPWKEPEELERRTIDQVRRFLKVHVPMRAAAQW
jgi:hypothetical protein